MNDPVNMVDSNGHKPISIKWFNLGNTFDLTATLAQLIVGGAAIGGEYAVVHAIRPNNIGIGLWNKQRAAAIAGFGDDVAKLNKVSNVLAAITVAVQVGEGIYTDINRGYSTDRVISNSVVNTVIYGGTMCATGAIGAKIGGAIGTTIPVVGTVVGAAVGFVLGTGVGLLLDMEIDGKSVIDYVRDWAYDTWTSWFN